MEIEKIVLENFRQYKDETISFSYGNDEKRFTIIQGAMGTGKTNILNALTWCLYGRELHLGRKDKGLPIINTITLYEMKKGETSEVKIELHMRDKDDKKIVFERTLLCRKLDNQEIKAEVGGKSDPNTQTNIILKRQVERDIKIFEGEDATYEINKLFPEDIWEYFFFDGERLDDYFTKSRTNKLAPYENVIKREVFKISQMALFEKVCDHLTKRRDSYARDARGINPAADEKKDLMDRLEAKLTKIADDIAKKQIDKSKAAVLEENLDTELRTYPPIQKVNELQSERETQESRLQRIEDDLKEESEKQLNYLAKSMILIKGISAIAVANDLLSKKVESGEIPPNYKRKFIQKLLENGKCICNTDISKDGKARDLVKQLVKECDELSEMGAEIIDLKHELEQLLNKAGEFRSEQRAINKRIRELEDDQKGTSISLKKLDDQLEGIDDEAVKRLEADRREARSEKERLIAEISALKADQVRNKRDLEYYTDQYNKEIGRSRQKAELSKILLFCNEALKAAEEIKEDILVEIKKEIEKKTKEQFFDLIWKKVNYQDVVINDDYEFSVLDQAKRESIGTLSAGESQILALSFMSALNMVSGFDSPIVIDTPLGRISKEPKINIAKKLPNFLKGKQVSLLVTEEEYTDEVRKYLKPHVGAEYSIRFKETKEGNEAKVVRYE